MNYPPVGVNGLSGYDAWKTTPPEGPELPICPICGEEGYPGERCRYDECDHYFPSEDDLREEADERRAEAMMEARWDDDHEKDVW